MEPIKVRLRRVVDFGSVTSFLGKEIGSDKTIVVHVDYRDVSTLWDAWKVSGFPQPLEFEAEQVTLNLEFHCEDEGDGEQLPATARLRGQRA